MQKNKRQVAIELDGLTYRVVGNRLETVRDLKELEGDVWLITDMQDSITRFMALDAEHDFVDVIIRKRLQETGEFDDSISILPLWKKKNGKSSTDIFFTALSSRIYSFYSNLIHKRDEIMLLFPLYSVLFAALKRMRARNPVAVVFQHGRFADILIGTHKKVYYANRCVAFDTSDEQINKLWNTAKADISNVSKDHRIEISEICLLTWIDSNVTSDWTNDSDFEVVFFENQDISYNGVTIQCSFMTALKMLTAMQSVSVPQEKACYYANRWISCLNVMMLVAAVIFLGSYFYFQKRADVLGNQIMALEGQITRMNVGRPGDIDREKFDQQFGLVKNLTLYRSKPSFKEIIDDLSAGISKSMEFEILKIDYITDDVQIEVFGHIGAPFKTAYRGYQNLINGLKNKGYALQESRFDTDIRKSQFLLKLQRTP